MYQLFISTISLYPLLSSPCIIYLSTNLLPLSSNLLPLSFILFFQYHPTFSLHPLLSSPCFLYSLFPVSFILFFLYPILFSPNIIQPSSCILYAFLTISSNLLHVSFILFFQYHPTCSLISYTLFSLYPLLSYSCIIYSLLPVSFIYQPYKPTFSHYPL